MNFGVSAGGKVSFATHPSILSGYGGQTFEQDPQVKAIKLKPASDDVEVLAKWDDGSAAMTSRKLGNGRVVCLGSTIWRNAKDSEGAWISQPDREKVLNTLLTDLGVDRHSDATSHDVWLGDFNSKNGLDHWLVAFNFAHHAQAVDLRFTADVKPTDVRNLTDGSTIPFIYDNGRVQLQHVQFAPMETKVFAIKRADLAAGLPFWWAEKTQYWKAASLPPLPAPARDPAHAGAMPLTKWKTIDDADSKIVTSDAWTMPQFDDGVWAIDGVEPRVVKPDFAGSRLFRTTVFIPPEWAGTAITLDGFSTGIPALCGSADVYVNGQKIDSAAFLKEIQEAHIAHPITVDINRLLKPGANTIAVATRGCINFNTGTFSGIGGVLYLQSTKSLTDAIDLTGQWTIVHLDHSTAEFSPGHAKAKGIYLTRDITIPAAWSGHHIRVRLAFASAWFKGVLIDDKLIVAPSFSSFGRNVEIDVTEYVQPGKPARLQLWGNALPIYQSPDPNKPLSDSAMDLQSATIGCIN